MKLTQTQKLHALAYRFYQGAAWTPKAGDFYTTSRADLELYQVVSVEGGIVRTRYTEGSDAISEWQEAGFLTEGFGPKRVFVPEWVLNLKPAASPEPLYRIGDETMARVFMPAGLQNVSNLQAVFDAVERALTKTAEPQSVGVPADLLEKVRMGAVGIRTWMPETLPANEQGQVHFARALAEAAAEAIEAILPALTTPPTPSIPADERQTADMLKRIDSYALTIFEKAETARLKAQAKFPQPNYVALKVAEEAGEVVRAAVHYAENRLTWEELEGEVVQTIAMLMRLLIEGDQINGIRPPSRAGSKGGAA